MCARRAPTCVGTAGWSTAGSQAPSWTMHSGRVRTHVVREPSTHLSGTFQDACLCERALGRDSTGGWAPTHHQILPPPSIVSCVGVCQLTVNYKKPILAGEVIVVVVKLVKQEGRKIFMEAEIIGDADGPQTKNVLATADCLMINIAQSSTWQQRVQKKEADESKTD